MPTPRSTRCRFRSVLVAAAIGMLGLVAGGDAASGTGDAAALLAVQNSVTPVGPFVGPVLGATGDLAVDAVPPPVTEAEIAAPGLGTAGPAATTAITSATGSLGIPAVVLAAYQRAAQASALADPGCRLSWALLASIGRIESGHASGGRVDAAGTTLGRILGPRLDGAPGVAAIRDSDRGALDGDGVWDRAVGPMQFIPTTWRPYRADGNGDGVADPHNIHDATRAAAGYLCAGPGDLSTAPALAAAIFRYNRSDAYVRTVIAWARAYATGVRPTESLTGPVPAPVDATGTPAAPEPPPAEVLAFLPPGTQPAPVGATVDPGAAVVTAPGATAPPAGTPVTTPPASDVPLTTTPGTTPTAPTPPGTTAPEETTTPPATPTVPTTTTPVTDPPPTTTQPSTTTQPATTTTSPAPQPQSATSGTAATSGTTATSGTPATSGTAETSGTTVVPSTSPPPPPP